MEREAPSHEEPGVPGALDDVRCPFLELNLLEVGVMEAVVPPLAAVGEEVTDHEQRIPQVGNVSSFQAHVGDCPHHRLDQAGAFPSLHGLVRGLVGEFIEEVEVQGGAARCISAGRKEAAVGPSV